MATAWFVCIDPVDKGKPASYLDKVDFRISEDTGSADYKTLQAGGIINWNGQPLIKWKGPFATEAEAKTAQNPQPAPGAGQAAQQAAQHEVQKIQSAILNDLFGGQTNILVRIGQIAAGLILIAVGVARITHAVPIATKVAKAVGTKGLA